MIIKLEIDEIEKIVARYIVSELGISADYVDISFEVVAEENCKAGGDVIFRDLSAVVSVDTHNDGD